MARAYARALDANPQLLDRLGPQLLAVLVQLGMTPRSRVEARPKDAAGEHRSALDELRARRDRRQHRAAAVDPAAP